MKKNIVILNEAELQDINGGSKKRVVPMYIGMDFTKHRHFHFRWPWS